MARKIRVGVEEIAERFESLEDTRSDVYQKHRFVRVATIGVVGVLAGADGPTAIALWTEIKKDFLTGVLSLPNGIPKKDVLLRVLSAIRPEAFQACFGDWLESLREKAEAASDEERPLLAVDGKTSHRRHDRKHGLGPLHSVSVWAADSGLTLAQVACAEKSNALFGLHGARRFPSF